MYGLRMDTKKKLVILIFVLLCAAYWFFAVRLDYSKIIFVLPSSSRTSSDFYYKRDGDFFLANDLRLGFEKLGYKVEYRFREDYDNLKLGNAGNILYFKGYYNFEHLPKNKSLNDGRKRILYIYYLEGLHMEIFAEADVIASASRRMIEEGISVLGYPSVYVPQFTNPDRFKPADKEADKAYKVLFVGSDHSGFGRQCIDYAILAKADLSVFGKKWEKSLDSIYLKGSFISNDDLYQYYANADIVLNDHRPDMRYYGIISNRIYDVAASGGFVLTDYMPEIEAIYGDSVAMYKNFYDFEEKLNYYLAHPELRAEMAEKARNITLSNFTNFKAAQILDSTFKNIKK